jgi:hypothetical protein
VSVDTFALLAAALLTVASVLIGRVISVVSPGENDS